MISRATTAFALSLALASATFAAPLRPGRTLSLDVARRAAAFTLPSEAWRSLHRVELPSPCAQPAVLLPDGTLAVALDAPPALSFISHGGDVLATVRLPARVTRPLTVGRDGRVFVSAGRTVVTVASDATIRSVVEMNTASESLPLVRSDGSAVVVTSANHRSIDFVEMSPEGDLARVTSRAGSMLSAPSWLDDDRVAVTTSDTLVTLDADGRVATGPCPAGVRHVAADDRTIAMITDTSLMLADARGSVRSTTPLQGAPEWLASVAVDRFAAALVAPNAPSELWVFDRGGAVTARLPLPHNTAAPTVDAAGAMLLAARGGELVAVGFDGAERWRLTTHETLRPPAVALPRGGVAIATEGSALLILDDTP